MMVGTPTIECQADKFWSILLDELLNGGPPLLIYLRELECNTKIHLQS